MPRYVPTKSQLSSSPLFLDRAPIGEGFFGQGDFTICTKRGEPKSQTPIMVLPPGVDIDEFMPKGREVVVVDNILDPPRDEGEEELSA